MVHAAQGHGYFAQQHRVGVDHGGGQDFKPPVVLFKDADLAIGRQGRLAIGQQSPGPGGAYLLGVGGQGDARHVVLLAQLVFDLAGGAPMVAVVVLPYGLRHAAHGAGQGRPRRHREQQGCRQQEGQGAASEAVEPCGCRRRGRAENRSAVKG